MIKKKWRRLTVSVLLLPFAWVLSWVAARCLIVSVPLDRADAIVVLSGSSTLMERVQHAARLYSEDRSRKILLTSDGQQGGWSQVKQRNPYSYERALEELGRLGVPSENIEVVQPAVYSTWDEAMLVSQYAEAQKLRSILIVTSSYHSRRALWSFRNAFRTSGIQVGLDPVRTGIQTPSPATWWLHGSGWRMVAVEYLKFGYYRISYFGLALA